METIKNLIEALSYCNKYIKVNKTKDYNHIISNTKFYTLKQCVIDYLIRNAKELNITIGACIVQTNNDKEDVTLIPIICDGVLYEFHQIYKNVENVLNEKNIKVINNGTIYEKPWRDTNINNELLFEEYITFIKDYVWAHYKTALKDFFMEKPIQYIGLVKLCSSKKGGRVDITYECNGRFVTNDTMVKLIYKGKPVIRKPLKDIRRNLQTYISQRELYIKQRETNNVIES